MHSGRSSGIEFAGNFRRHAPSALAPLSSRGFVAARINHLRSSGEPIEIPPEETFVLSYLLTPFHHSDLWLDNRATPWAPLRAGELHAYDLAERIRADIKEPVEFLYIHLPRSGLEAFAIEHDLPVPGIQPFRSGMALCDQAIARAAVAILPQIAMGPMADQLLLDEIGLQLQTRFLHHLAPPGRWLGYRGGLTPRQELRAKDLLTAHMADTITIADLARECGLSRSHFMEAFRRSTGLSPHRWLAGRRIEHAKMLLLHSSLPLADIALACGFAHQPHFTRVFGARMGATPGAWRDAHARSACR